MASIAINTDTSVTTPAEASAIGMTSTDTITLYGGATLTIGMDLSAYSLTFAGTGTLQLLAGTSIKLAANVPATISVICGAEDNPLPAIGEMRCRSSVYIESNSSTVRSILGEFRAYSERREDDRTAWGMIVGMNGAEVTLDRETTLSAGESVCSTGVAFEPIEIQSISGRNVTLSAALNPASSTLVRFSSSVGLVRVVASDIQHADDIAVYGVTVNMTITATTGRMVFISSGTCTNSSCISADFLACVRISSSLKFPTRATYAVVGNASMSAGADVSIDGGYAGKVGATRFSTVRMSDVAIDTITPVAEASAIIDVSTTGTPRSRTIYTATGTSSVVQRQDFTVYASLPDAWMLIPTATTAKHTLDIPYVLKPHETITIRHYALLSADEVSGGVEIIKDDEMARTYEHDFGLILASADCDQTTLAWQVQTLRYRNPTPYQLPVFLRCWTLGGVSYHRAEVQIGGTL